MTNDTDIHELDESLGDIHECAIALQIMGLPEWAMKLGHAHEKIQEYLIKETSE